MYTNKYLDNNFRFFITNREGGHNSAPVRSLQKPYLSFNSVYKSVYAYAPFYGLPWALGPLHWSTQPPPVTEKKSHPL